MNLVTILACHGCTYERVFPTWVAFAIIRLSIILILSLRRFDPIRILGVFALYELVFFYAWQEAVRFSAISDSAIGMIASIILTAFLSFGFPAAIILVRANRYKYMKGNSSIVFSKKRAAFLVFMFTGLSFYQGL